MFREKKQYGQDPNTVVRSAKATFYKPLHWKDAARVFTCSWSDFFVEEADAWRADAWDVIRKTPHLAYQVLTKRPENILDRLPADWADGWPNVWLGVSAENQTAADERIPALLSIPARVRFVSAEPLLGPVDLRPWMPVVLPNGTPLFSYQHGYKAALNWVIVGGESGPKARPMHPGWARQLRDQCQTAGVPLFFKQWGEWIPKTECGEFIPEFGWQVKASWTNVVKGHEWGCLDIDSNYDEGTTTWNGRQGDARDGYEVTVYRVGKKAAGAMLDGREWKEFPDG
jgi:protein gp37